MHTAAIDFETVYTNDLGVEKQGVWHYCRHPEFDAYLVTVAGSDGTRYCGRPENFNWSAISGADWRWVSHNRSFDQPVYESLVERGVVAPNMPGVWDCTADMSAYFGAPRSLAYASAHFLDVEVSKDTRNKMKGKRWEDMPPEFQAEVEDYAKKDAELCLNLWLQESDRWPEHERWLSRETTRMAVTGVPVDTEMVRESVVKLKTLIWEARQRLPWVEEDEKPLSPLALAEECRKHGILPPASTAEDSPECERWEAEHGEKFTWVKDMRQIRKCNGLLKKLEAMEQRTRPSGWMGYGLKYFGASVTGRDSADSKLNLQNLNRGESYGVDIRKHICAPSGMKLVICDLSQIEPRCLAWLAGDHDLLDFIRNSPDLYEAQARAWGFWDKPEPLKTDTTGIRHLVKTLNLGLGYGMGVSRFMDTTGMPLSEADRLVKLFRSKNPKVFKLWKLLENNLRAAVMRNDDWFEVELPSGRKLRYRHPNNNEGVLSAETVKGKGFMRLKWWGGSLTENCTQGMARDVFMGTVRTIRDAGIDVIMRVHDELVCCVHEDQAEDAKNFIVETMSTPPEWARDLPLAAEAKITQRYEK